MANIVEFIIKIVDPTSSSVFGRMAQSGDSAFSRLTNRVSSFRGQLNNLGSSINDIDKKLDELTRTRNMSIDGRQVREINREMRELESRRGRLTGEGGRSGGIGFGGIARIAGLGSVLALGGTIMKAGMERQMAGTSFNVMAGKKDGTALHQNLIKFATDSIYGNEVFGEAKTMMAFGVGVKQIMPAMNMLGDIALGDAERMKSLALAFGQTKSAGKLMGQDLLQYTSAAFNPLQALSDKTGKSMAYFKEQMTKGKISFQDVVSAMEYATGPMGRFHNGMKDISNTPTGKWIAFTGALETLGGTIGMKVLPVLGGVATLLNGIISNETVFYSIAAGIGAMTAAWGLYTAWVARAAIWNGILGATIAVLTFPFTFAIVMIGVIAAALVVIARKFDGWGTSAKAAWQVTKDFFTDVKIGIVDFAQTVEYAFKVSFYKIKGFFEQISGAWQKVKHGDFSGAWSTPVKTESAKLIERLTAQHDADRKKNLTDLMANNSLMGIHAKGIHLTKSGSGISPVDSPAGISTGKGSMPTSMADTNKGISGGGVRNLTINVGNLGTGKIDIHAATLTEGAAEIRRIFEEMFLQVVNSGNAAISG